MPTYSKLMLSGSDSGKQILVAGTGTGNATAIHTAVSGTGSIDEIYLYASNNATASLNLTLLWGGTTEPNDQSVTPLQSKAGRMQIADGKLLNNGNIVKAYSDINNLIAIDGFVNRITP